MVDEKIIKDAVEMTKDIPATDVLVPLQQEEQNLAPLPKVEYKVIEAPTMDKLVRDVNAHLDNGRVCDGGIQVSNGISTRFYQSMERRNVDYNDKVEIDNTIHIPGLENEPDLYEDINENATE